MKHRRLTVLIAILTFVAVAIGPSFAGATEIKNICRVKGQEENILQGLGLVVGLKGTGDAGDLPTMRALARSMEIMGSPISPEGLAGEESLDALKKNKNVALVMVEAVVPPTGARRGDKLNCSVMGLSGKSLAGGRLTFAALQGPDTGNRRVYALARGAVHIEDSNAPLVGTIHQGCRLEQDIRTPFHLDGEFTLVLEKNHANFHTATDIVETIRDKYPKEVENIARAVDASNIVVAIPDHYRDAEVAFVAEVLGIRLYEPQPEARVVINERTGSIVITGKIEIGSVVVAHKNLIVETDAAAQFVGVDTTESNPARLNALLNPESARRRRHRDHQGN